MYQNRESLIPADENFSVQNNRYSTMNDQSGGLTKEYAIDHQTAFKYLMTF